MSHDPALSVRLPGASTHGAAFQRFLLIGVLAFLTVVDLFAAQAILPALTRLYGVTPAAMGNAVNASTLGMAAAGLGMAFFGHRIGRRAGVLAALLLLAVPTLLLSIAPDLTVFAALRVAQGLCMATAFTLTLAHLGETLPRSETAGAFAAYITGNVASNLVGRLIAAGVADHLGVSAAFFAFASLNLAGAALAFLTLRQGQGASVRSVLPAAQTTSRAGPVALAGNGAVLAGLGVGFCILFAFIGTFTYVNFVLVRPPLSLGMMSVGFVYLVFTPSIVTTPLAGAAVGRLGTRGAVWLGLGTALAGLPLAILPSLPAVLAGLCLVGIGTFLAQAVATGFVSRAAGPARASAGGLYLASYFAGGLVGSAALGQVFDRAGWTACAAGIGAALIVAALLALRFDDRLPAPTA